MTELQLHQTPKNQKLQINHPVYNCVMLLKKKKKRNMGGQENMEEVMFCLYISVLSVYGASFYAFHCVREKER